MNQLPNLPWGIPFPRRRQPKDDEPDHHSGGVPLDLNPRYGEHGLTPQVRNHEPMPLQLSPVVPEFVPQEQTALLNVHQGLQGIVDLWGMRASVESSPEHPYQPQHHQQQPHHRQQNQYQYHQQHQTFEYQQQYQHQQHAVVYQEHRQNATHSEADGVDPRDVLALMRAGYGQSYVEKVLLPLLAVRGNGTNGAGHPNPAAHTPNDVHYPDYQQQGWGSRYPTERTQEHGYISDQQQEQDEQYNAINTPRTRYLELQQAQEQERARLPEIERQMQEQQRARLLELQKFEQRERARLLDVEREQQEADDAAREFIEERDTMYRFNVTQAEAHAILNNEMQCVLDGYTMRRDETTTTITTTTHEHPTFESHRAFGAVARFERMFGNPNISASVSPENQENVNIQGVTAHMERLAIGLGSSSPLESDDGTVKDKTIGKRTDNKECEINNKRRFDFCTLTPVNDSPDGGMEGNGGRRRSMTTNTFYSHHNPLPHQDKEQDENKHDGENSDSSNSDASDVSPTIEETKSTPPAEPIFSLFSMDNENNEVLFERWKSKAEHLWYGPETGPKIDPRRIPPDGSLALSRTTRAWLFLPNPPAAEKGWDFAAKRRRLVKMVEGDVEYTKAHRAQENLNTVHDEGLWTWSRYGLFDPPENWRSRMSRASDARHLWYQ